MPNAYVWRSENNFGIVLSSHGVSFGVEFRLSGLEANAFYPLSHLIGPSSSFFGENVVVAVIDHRSHNSFMRLAL